MTRRSPVSRRALAPLALLLAALAPFAPARAQPPASAPADSGPVPPARPPWYEHLSFRGYLQLRYSGLLRTNPNLTCAQCDRSIGRNGGILLRRARLIFSGDVNERLYVYLQPDFANDVGGGTQGVLQLRDAYVDLALDRARTTRLRFGQSKMPYGWENMQSSGVRVPFDRSDAINAALINERDLGVVAYWAPAAVRQRLRMLVDSGLKGSGDYGVLALGAYNGQGLNRPEANDQLHVVARASYPARLPNGQVVEAGVQAYAGRYVLPSTLRSAGLVATTPAAFDDRRVAATFVLYPQPFGLQAEWNVGRGPEADPAARTVRTRSLDGGYVLASWRARPRGTTLIPYVQAHRYRGGKKFEQDARRYRVRELQAGAEWTAAPGVELTVAYQWSDRRYEDLQTPQNRQRGRLLRVQTQFSF